MDSLTQIMLGAAVGEAVLGRKIGNRAMLWGAIGGTIPDFDVLANFTMSELDALSFHRGITHSVAFSVVAGLFCAFVVHRLYQSETYRRTWYKTLVTLTNILLLLLLSYAINRLAGSVIVTIALSGLSAWLIWRLVTRYLRRPLETIETSYRDWAILFFLAMFTHVLLDCCTTYGTQVFQPFSDYRAAFNIISVADPAYTLPFLIMVVLAATRRRSDRARQVLNWLGIGLSSLYLVATAINKQRVDTTFAEALEHRGITPDRCRCSPTILNNLLWTCVAEDPDAFYVGLYSIHDTDKHLHVLNRLPRKDSIDRYLGQFEAYHTLRWFSDGYLYPTMTDTAVILTDLRFGAMHDTVVSDRDFVFSFIAHPGQEDFALSQRRPKPENFAREFQVFVDRVLGY